MTYVDVLANGSVVLREGAESARAYSVAQDQLVATLGKSQQQFSVHNEELVNQRVALAEMGTELDTTRGKMGAVSRTITDQTIVYDDWVIKTKSAGEATKQTGEDMRAGGEAALESAGMVNEAKELWEGADTTASDVAEGVSEAGDEVATTAGEIVASVEDIQAAETAAVVAQAAVATAMEKIDADSAASLAAMQAISESIQTTAEAMLLAVTNAIVTGTNEVAGAGETMAQSVTDAVSGILSETEGASIGTTFAGAVGTGIAGQAETVNTASAGLGSGALAALWEVVGPNGSNFEAIGQAISDGVAQGIQAGASKIESAAWEAARGAYSASMKELDAHSPSRKMAEVGRYYSEGFAEGIESRADRVMASVRSLANRAVMETEAGLHAPTVAQGQSLAIDYDRLADATVAAMRRAGLGEAVVTMDGREVGRTVEPSVSRETLQRSKRTAAGRTARMVYA